MQSQLEAALLGHNTLSHDEDESNFQEEDNEDTEEFDEDNEEVATKNSQKFVNNSGRDATTHRTVTLQNLLSAGILEPGLGAMTIEYLGQKFVGDLLEDGKIRSQETDVVFASPSAWAIACKRFINPDKKSGCGWASVKYKGKKLDAYKNIWYKKKKEDDEKIEKENINHLENILQKNMANALMYQRVVVKHNTIANRNLTHDANTMIDCVPFSNLGKIQPFLVSILTNAALLMDFHCHLTKSEVSGYLAGYWDVNSHNLQITHAFPCRCSRSDRENAAQVESEIAKKIEKEKLTLVGWYHSHPFAAAAPTLRDIDAQLDYQIKMKGTNDNSYTPCIGIIISPYNYENTSLESSIIAYWVIPPPETKPNEYGKPMLMSYSVIQDSTLTAHVKNEMLLCVDYYKKEKDVINLTESYLNNTCYLDKLKTSLLSKFPREENEVDLWKTFREILGLPCEDKEQLLSIPNVNKTVNNQTLLPPVTTNMIIPTDLSSILFNSGKFSTSLLGLPDPMAHSTLAANNMFLQSNFFKMQELLKPKTTSKTTSSPSSSSPLKIPSKISEFNFAKTDFSMPDLKLSKEMFSVSDYLASLTKSSLQESMGDFTLNLCKSEGERAAKVQKVDFTTVNLCKSSDNVNKNGGGGVDEPKDLRVTGEKSASDSKEVDEKPLNLAGD